MSSQMGQKLGASVPYRVALTATALALTENDRYVEEALCQADDLVEVNAIVVVGQIIFGECANWLPSLKRWGALRISAAP